MTTLTARPETNAPAYRKASYAEYLEGASETRIIEWVDGEMITYMPPILKHQQIGRYHTQVLPHFWLNVEWLWEDPMPASQLALAEIIISDETFPADLRQLYQGLSAFLKSQQT